MIDFFIENRSKIAKDISEELFFLHSEAQNMQKQIAEEYLEIEKQYLDHEKYLDDLKGMKNIKEKNLIKQNIIF